MWKWKFNREKCKVLLIGSKNIKVEYELSKREIKNVNEKCNLEIGFNDTLKAENHILFIKLRANRMIGWMARNLVLRKTNVLKYIKSLYRILCLGLGSSVETWKLPCYIEIGGHTKERDKTNWKRKKLQLQEESREIRINYFARKTIERWSNWNFQNNKISNHGRHFFSIFLLEFEIYWQGRFQKQSLQTNWIFLEQIAWSDKKKQQ